METGGEASTATTADAEHVEQPAQQAAVAPADPATAPSPAKVLSVLAFDEALGEGGPRGVHTAEVPVQGEKKGAVSDERHEEEAVATIHEPPQKVGAKPKARGELLLDLIQSFRGGMLRVDSNLRATMFRSLRYLVRSVSSK